MCLQLNPKGWSFIHEDLNCKSNQKSKFFISKGKIIVRDGSFKGECFQVTPNEDFPFKNNSKIENDLVVISCKSGYSTILLGVKPIENVKASFEPTARSGFKFNIFMLGFDSVFHKMWESCLNHSKS